MKAVLYHGELRLVHSTSDQPEFWENLTLYALYRHRQRMKTYNEKFIRLTSDRIIKHTPELITFSEEEYKKLTHTHNIKT